ncbi:ATP-dependent zinc metalloprotease FtsH [Trichinella pseudospiralis]
MVLNFTACGKVNMMCLKEIAPYTTARIVRGLIEEEIRFTDFKSKEQELCACWLASIIHIFTSAPDPALSLLTLAALHHVNQAAPSSLDKPLQSFWKSSLVRVGVVTTAGANQSRPTVFNGFTSTERSEFNCRPRWAN